MNAFPLEKCMTPVVRDWLEGEGLRVMAEVSHMHGAADLAACSIDMDRARVRRAARKWTPRSMADLPPGPCEWFPCSDTVHAVELKLHRMAEVERQARHNLLWATHSWIAMPATRAAVLRERLAGTPIGVMAVHPDGVEVLAGAKRNKPTWFHFAARTESFWRAFRADVRAAIA